MRAMTDVLGGAEERMAQVAELLPHVRRIQELAEGAILFAALRALVRTRAADHLGEEPREVPDIAADAGVDPLALRRVLRALSAIDVVRAEDERYAATPLARALRSTSPLWPSLAHRGSIDVAGEMAH